MTGSGSNDPRRNALPRGFTGLSSGTRLDNRYTIDSVIASGGFGITYMGQHDALGKTVAIKEHFPRQFAYREGGSGEVRLSDPDTFRWTLDRFLREGQSLATCKHPNVVDANDVFEANGTAYMVLSYEDGQSLNSWLASLGRVPTQAEVDALLSPLLDALEFVHQRGMLHRDIAPDNIIIRRDGTPCLIDFGAARHAIAERSQLMSAIVKTGYSPPEQYTTSGKAQGPWTDIYALGATLYRAVSGHVPPEAIERQITDDLIPLKERHKNPEHYRLRFLEGIDTALRLRQEHRPQSIAAWRQTLFEAPQTSPIVERLAPPPLPTPSPSPIAPDFGPLSGGPWIEPNFQANRTRHSVPLFVGSAVGLLFLCAFLYVWLSNSGWQSLPKATASKPAALNIRTTVVPDNPTEQLALYLTAIETGQEKFDVNVSREAVTAKLKFSPSFRSAYGELVERIQRQIGERGYFTQKDVADHLRPILGEERLIDLLASTSPAHVAPIIYLRALQRGDASFPSINTTPSGSEVFEQLKGAFPRMRRDSETSAFLRIFDRTVAGVKKQAEEQGGRMSIWSIVSQMRRNIIADSRT